ncbi:phage tail protein I [Vibrio sp. PP-XX7]
MAWELSVDEWDDDWSEVTKRDVVASALAIHLYKGTRYALDKSIETVRSDRINTVEYFQDPEHLKPGFFRVDLVALNSSVGDDTFSKIRHSVLKAKNTRSHLDSISVTARSECTVKRINYSRIGAVFQCGPWRAENIQGHCSYLLNVVSHLGMVVRSGPLPVEFK